MATKRIVIGVEDQFSRPLSNYERAMGGAASATEKFSRSASSAGGSGGWRQMATDLAHVAQGAQGVYSAISGVVSKANEWGQVGIAAARNEIAFRSLAGGAEEYRAKIDAITRATRGMVTEGEAAGTAYRLQRFGLADTAAEMERFMRTVSIVSAINPQLGGTAEAINQIQLTLSNMSFMRLDQLGVSAGQVRARMAELKQETKGLSDEQAFQTAVMEQLGQQAEAVGDSILDMNDASERMQARWRGFKEDWGLKIAQGFETIATAADKWADAMDRGSVLNYGPGTPQGPSGTLTAEQRAQAERYWADWQTGFQPARTPNPTQVQIPHDLNYSYWYERQAQDRVDQASYQARQQFRTPRGTMSAMADMMGYSDATWGASQLPVTPGRQIAPTARLGMGVLGGADFGAAERSLDKMARSSQEIKGNLSAAATEWDSLNEKFGIDPKSFDTDVYSKMTSALNEAGVESQEAADAMLAYELATGMATGSSELFDASLSALTDQLVSGKINAEQYAKAVQDLGQADFSGIDRLTQQMAAAGMSMQQVGDAMDRIAALPPSLQSMGYGTTSADYQGAVFDDTGHGYGDWQAERGTPMYTPGVGGDVLQHMTDLSTASQTTAGDIEGNLTGAFRTASSEGVLGIDRIKQSMDELNGREIHVRTIVDIQTQISNALALPEGVRYATGGAGDATVPAGVDEFASGGWTGSGGDREIAGVVHRNEYVLSKDMLRTLRSGGGGGTGGRSEPLEATIVINDQAILKAWVEARRKRGN